MFLSRYEETIQRKHYLHVFNDKLNNFKPKINNIFK